MASPIIVVERALLKSDAFRLLNGNSKTILFDFLMKCTIGKSKARPGRSEKIILNNGKIEYCYSEAEKRGISRQRFAKAIDDLIEKGFIDISHSGAGGHKGDKSLYSISERWRSFDMVGFTVVTRPKDTRKGRGYSIYWKRKAVNMGMKNDTPSSMKSHTPR